MTTAALYFAAAAPLIQFLAFGTSTPAYPQQWLVWAAFAVHAVTWVGAFARQLPVWAVLMSWTTIAVTIAAQGAAAHVIEPVAPRNISMTIAACAALLLPTGAAVAVTAAISAAASAALVMGARPAPMTVWNAAAILPVYTLGVAAGLSLAFGVLYAVAREADAQAQARLSVDRTVQRAELAAQARRLRARRMHDTIVNTLGAISAGRIVSSAPLVSRRCAEDAVSAEQLRTSAIPIHPTIDDVFKRANELGVRIDGIGVDGLRDRLEAEPSWRRRELIALIRELVTNVAKHADVGRVAIEYDAALRTVTVTDTGVGMADRTVLEESLSARAQDSAVAVDVTTAPGAGTRISLHIKPIPMGAGRVFEAASARMATVIGAAMLCQFALASVVSLAFGGSWSWQSVWPPALTWLITAGVLLLLVNNGGRRRHLSTGSVLAAYAGLAAMHLVYRVAGVPDSVCGLSPTLAWAGDAAATIFALLVLVDGRLRVVVPAVALTTLGVGEMLSKHGSDCSATTFAMFTSDVLVIGAFYILRRKTLRLSAAVVQDVDDQLRGREQQERAAVAEALDNDGFDATLAFSRQILTSVADDPRRARTPEIRASAGLEEGYLRALIRLTAGIATPTATRRFVGLIDGARVAQVGLAVHTDPGVLDDESADAVVEAVADLLQRCEPGDELSIGVYGPPTEPSMMIVAPPRALVGYPHGRQTQELGLVEVRWPVGAHRRS